MQVHLNMIKLKKIGKDLENKLKIMEKLINLLITDY